VENIVSSYLPHSVSEKITENVSSSLAFFLKAKDSELDTLLVYHNNLMDTVPVNQRSIKLQ
jgi:hypothetical protein